MNKNDGLLKQNMFRCVADKMSICILLFAVTKIQYINSHIYVYFLKDV